MKAIIDGIKANLPIIVAVLAFGVAAAIVAYLLVRYFKNKSKKPENVGKEAGFPSGNEATSDDNLFTDKNGADDSVAATETEENTMKDKKAETAKTTKPASKAEEKKPMKTAAKTAAKSAAKDVKPTARATAEPAAKKSASKTAVKPAAKKAEPVKEAKATVGKWIIKEKGEGEFVAFLYANNGEIMLTSEIYTSEESARAGIDTIRKNVDGGTFVK